MPNFIDEPTAGLDVIARDSILELLREYMETEGRSILISSHISSDLEQYGYSSLTDERAFYAENYPQLAIERGSVDKVITMMIKGEVL